MEFLLAAAAESADKSAAYFALGGALGAALLAIIGNQWGASRQRKADARHLDEQLRAERDRLRIQLDAAEDRQKTELDAAADRLKTELEAGEARLAAQLEAEEERLAAQLEAENERLATQLDAEWRRFETQLEAERAGRNEQFMNERGQKDFDETRRSIVRLTQQCLSIAVVSARQVALIRDAEEDVTHERLQQRSTGAEELTLAARQLRGDVVVLQVLLGSQHPAVKAVREFLTTADHVAAATSEKDAKVASGEMPDKVARVVAAARDAVGAKFEISSRYLDRRRDGEPKPSGDG